MDGRREELLNERKGKGTSWHALKQPTSQGEKCEEEEEEEVQRTTQTC